MQRRLILNDVAGSNAFVEKRTGCEEENNMVTPMHIVDYIYQVGGMYVRNNG